MKRRNIENDYIRRRQCLLQKTPTQAVLKDKVVSPCRKHTIQIKLSISDFEGLRESKEKQNSCRKLGGSIKKHSLTETLSDTARKEEAEAELQKLYLQKELQEKIQAAT